MEWVIVIGLGVVANGVTALLGYIFKYFVAGDSTTPALQEEQSRSLTEVVDEYVKERRLAERARQPAYEYQVEHRVVIEQEKESNSDEAIGVVFAILVVISILASIWNAYKVQLFWITGASTIVGWVISFYFVDVLRKMAAPHRKEDYVLTLLPMAVWFLGFLGLFLGVYAPVYRSPVPSDELNQMVIQAAHFVGAACIYAAIVMTATLQFTMASVYRKGLQGVLPNGFEVFIWEIRWVGIVLIPVALGFGFWMASGLWF